MSQDTNKPSLPSTLYTEEYFLNACEGYEEFVESQGERLSRRLSEAFAYAEVKPGMKVAALAEAFSASASIRSLRAAEISSTLSRTKMRKSTAT